jgi:hypothetical protein
MRTIGLPEIIVMLGVLVIIPLVALIVIYLVRHLQTQERLRAIEKGVPVPAILGDPWERAARTRRWGIVLVAGGLGLIPLFAVVSTTDKDGFVGLAMSAIPIFIGIGLLYEYRLRARDLSARSTAQAPRDLTQEEQDRK